MCVRFKHRMLRISKCAIYPKLQKTRCVLLDLRHRVEKDDNAISKTRKRMIRLPQYILSTRESSNPAGANQVKSDARETKAK